MNAVMGDVVSVHPNYLARWLPLCHIEIRGQLLEIDATQIEQLFP